MDSIASVLDSSCNLTDREIEILELLIMGRSNKDIASRLSISIRTVKFHTNHLYTKLSVGSRLEATAWVWERYRNRMERVGQNLYQSTGEEQAT